MDIRIGVTDNPQPIVLQLADDTDRDVKARIDTAIGGGGVLWLTDDKGKEVAVPAARLAFVELGQRQQPNRVRLIA